MKDVIGRFVFVLWVLCGMLLLGFGFAGASETTMLILSILVLSPIVIAFLHTVVRWIVSGNTD